MEYRKPQQTATIPTKPDSISTKTNAINIDMNQKVWISVIVMSIFV